MVKHFFKLLSLLLAYPDADLRQVAPEIAAMLRSENGLPVDIANRLAVLTDDIAATDLLDTQERYVALFDQTRTLSLYLFEHVHGESRDRGQAMVDLRTHYEQHGLFMEPGELPDYLPLLLEFLSVIPEVESRQLLGDVRPLVISLAERLAKRRSPYAAVLDAVLALAPAVVDSAARESASPDEEPAAMRDEAWAEAPVQFTAAPVPAPVRIGDIP